jgi:exonuclease VII large subunit
MDSQNTDTVAAAGERRVPDDLMAQLHAANQQLHDARTALEAAMDESVPSHQQKVDQAEQAMRDAEAAIEQISNEIHKAIAALPAK